MAISVPGSVTGSAQTGFTTPGFTVVADQQPAYNARKWAVSALTGTQTGASATSTSAPFTVTVYRPQVFAIAPRLNSNGALVGTGWNNWSFVFHKGMLPLAGQAPQVATCVMNFKLPAGADLASPGELKSMYSFIGGVIPAVSAGTGDSFISGVF